jgi:hypothetical protein
VFFHVVVTFDGETLFLFVNGSQVAATVGNADLDPSDARVLIGEVSNWGRHTGVIDEVAIYDKPLAPARIAAHHEAASAK